MGAGYRGSRVGRHSRCPYNRAAFPSCPGGVVRQGISRMHVLITGGAGFIGSNLAELALKAGHRVTVVDDLSTGFADNLDGLDVTFVEGTVLDLDMLTSAMSGVDSVVHLAALGSVPRSIKDPFATHA